MVRLPLRKRLLDLVLNAAFVTWVFYFLATGSVIPEFLLRDSPPETVEVQPDEVPAAPDVVQEETS